MFSLSNYFAFGEARVVDFNLEFLLLLTLLIPHYEYKLSRTNKSNLVQFNLLASSGKNCPFNSKTNEHFVFPSLHTTILKISMNNVHSILSQLMLPAANEIFLGISFCQFFH